MNVKQIEKAVEQLCLKANFYLRKDVVQALKHALKIESSSTGKEILKILIENQAIARRQILPLCQDTGMVIVFLEIGQGVRIKGGSIEKAVNRGVARAYRRGSLRASVVKDPLIRINTGDNTPVVIHTKIVPGARIKIYVAPKGFGSENMSSISMLKPTATQDEIIDYILDVVKKAGGKACPPLILGIGIGGTMEKAGILSKEALLQPIDRSNPKKHLMRLEREILKRVNSLGLGPMGLGGKVTCLGVNILAYATHIAGLPVAVSLSCHALRGGKIVL
ncbi:MAG: fumarate hydratase [Candidatus Omnitrophica bacterium]|nr:fumarate hydratase [Candidatus Omnitrophota bacterium]